MHDPRETGHVLLSLTAESKPRRFFKKNQQMPPRPPSPGPTLLPHSLFEGSLESCVACAISCALGAFSKVQLAPLKTASLSFPGPCLGLGEHKQDGFPPPLPSLPRFPILSRSLCHRKTLSNTSWSSCLAPAPALRQRHMATT